MEFCLSDYSYVSTCPAFSVPVKEKLTADPDSEIATTSLRVSLICPVNKASALDCYQSKIHILMTTLHLWWGCGSKPGKGTSKAAEEI